jgi:NADH-quinone oxidoreductase subunit J
VSVTFAIIAVATLLGAISAMALRNLVHCALALILTFAGLAAAYLHLQAQFVGFAQILVYVGAVAMLILFSVLLTRAGGPDGQPVFSGGWKLGVGIAVLVAGVLCVAIFSSRVLPTQVPPAPETTVRHIGDRLMTQYILPLEVIGLLLTVALIGGVILAMRERRPE